MNKLRQFIPLVNYYIQNIEACLRMIERCSEKRDDFKNVRSGYLNNEQTILFEFHGAGCLVINKSLEIDFELPFQDVSQIPLDLYFLIRFWKSCEQKFGYSNENEISEDFQLAKSDAMFNDHPFNSHQIMVPFPKKFIW